MPKSRRPISFMAAPVTLAGAVLILAGAAGLIPEALLLFDREAIVRGEYWRLITAHLTHWDAAHAGVNLVVLVPFWWIFETRRGSLSALLTWLAGCATVSGAMWWIEPDLLLYAGASGLACTGVVAVGATLLADRPHANRWAGALLLSWLLGKLALESITGWTPASSAASAGTHTVHLAHWAGALAGLFGLMFAGRHEAAEQVRLAKPA